MEPEDGYDLRDYVQPFHDNYEYSDPKDEAQGDPDYEAHCLSMRAWLDGYFYHDATKRGSHFIPKRMYLMRPISYLILRGYQVYQNCLQCQRQGIALGIGRRTSTTKKALEWVPTDRWVHHLSYNTGSSKVPFIPGTSFLQAGINKTFPTLEDRQQQIARFLKWNKPNFTGDGALQF